MTVQQMGDSALLLELEPRIDPAVNARAVAIAAALRQQTIAGVRDVINTFRSVAVHFDPLRTRLAEVEQAMAEAVSATVAAAVATTRTVNVPVIYGGVGGPDLAEVAALSGLSEADVVSRHTARTYRVFMLGFMPGYPYMGVLDERLAVPRLATPRLSVTAGSVAIAGLQTGIYPRTTPGGWRIIGRTNVELFDETREPPAYLEPGSTVRFVSVDRLDSADRARRGPDNVSSAAVAANARRITVLRPGVQTTVQDMGRWGYQHLGVPVAGPMDQTSHRLANLLVGNDAAAATLEVTLVGPDLRIDNEALLAVSGADLGATLNGTPLALDTAVRARAGDRLRFGPRRAGVRAYLACDGGIDVTPVLGSRSTHLPSGMGGFRGRGLQAGDCVAIGTAQDADGSRPRRIGRDVTAPRSGARLRVLPGPQAGFFDGSALDRLSTLRFVVSSQSNRMGYRLTGAHGIAPRTHHEMISDATCVGGIQIPPSGDPLLLMADRQTTGGYPQVATVISADLPRAAQLAPGDWMEFELCTVREALAALIAQESRLLAVR